MINTGQFRHLFLSGTGSMGSCQRIDGVPKEAKCLMGYVVDWKNRIIAVTDETGKMMARSIIRILWGYKIQRPALLCERVYPDTATNDVRGAILNAAKKIAGEMKLDLFENTKEGEGVKNEVLVSFASNAPFEYKDGVGVTNGTYKVKHFKLIQEAKR